jgi:uncharacterized protein
MTGLALDTPSGENIIRWVRADAIGVGPRELRRSFAVSAAALIEDWHVTDVAAIGEADIDRLLDTGCDVVLLGAGERQQQLAPALLYRALRRGIGIEVMTNAAAARTYNLLLAEERRVLAAFILPAGG